MHNKFYKDGIKVLTKENLKLLNHPVGLMTLYLDDGTLVMDKANRNNKKKHIFPRISIATMCFTLEENQLLCAYIAKVFNVNFKIKKCPFGHGYLIEINKRNEINTFVDLISSYYEDIIDMNYKLNIKSRLEEEAIKNPTYSVAPLKNTIPYYTQEEIDTIIYLRSLGKTYNEIATTLNRTYDGILYKIRDLRKKKKL